ncbi:MAG: AzlC family ABC transporter permease [Marinovum sp.]|nr:AzlC family ABC transporter permease [Marinovum sp.]
MSQSKTSVEFFRGVRDTLPFCLVIVPFSMLFGLVSTEAGLSVLETLTFSLVVIAGAAQFTALGLMQENAPTIVVIISALAVNMRMAIYSASLVPHMGPLPFWKRALAAYFLVDQPYAMSMNRFDAAPKLSLREKTGYFWGCTLLVVPVWYSMTLLGALVGQRVPEWLALDFAVPITFLAVVAPMLRTFAHVVAALVSIVAALIFASMPYQTGLLVAGLAGMMAGAEVERRRSQ